MEGSLVAYKVFTNGSVLQASEINDNLMRQSVMVFSNAAARTAAITTPLEGMLTWLEDINRYESYNGSAWVSPFGSTLLRTVEWTAQAQVIVDNVFTSEFDHYKVFLVATNSINTVMFMRLRTSAPADLSAAEYNQQFLTVDGTTLTGARATAQTQFSVAGARTEENFTEFHVSYPAAATRRTAITANSSDPINGISLNPATAQYRVTTAAAGFRLFPNAGTSTGKLQVYGFRN
jgi:hypothetical protein